MKERHNYQTPQIVCDYMVSLINPINPISLGILEPTPGEGNLVKAITDVGFLCLYPYGDYWESDLRNERYDYVVMNPPFTPMSEGYKFLDHAMVISDRIVALMPWLTLINSESRTKTITDFGLLSVTHLPRRTFPNCRVQCCILELRKGFNENTTFDFFNW